ncbi:MAG TPA: TolC family outer membrane protein [Gammaproteobacteria bacterium]|nr:TolC family outer membrane protein [Gammaproteobacteria bacterium]
MIKLDHTLPIALIVAGIGVAAPIGAEDLVAIYTLAEQQDPQFQQVEASRRAILAVKPQARAQLMLPSVTISANVTRNFQDISIDTQAQGDIPVIGTQGGVIGVIPATDLQGVSGSGYTEFTSGDYTLSITQPVYHYDRTLQYRQADTRIQQANAEFGAARQDLIVRVAERYFDVLAAMDTLEFAGAEKQALFQQLDQAKQRFEVGLVAITDVQEAQAGYDRAVADRIQAENLLENAREALRELTNQYHQTLLKLGEEIPLIAPVPPNIDRWIAKSLEQNLRLAAAFQATKVARQEIARQSAGHRPTLDLIASHGFSTTGGRFAQADIDSSAIGLQFNLPIYQGGQVNSRTREAQHRHEEALARLEQERRAAHRQAHDAYLGVIAGISRVKALRQAVISNQTSSEATQAGFEVGTRTGVDVVNAQREVFRAKRDYAQSRYDYILDTLRLKRAAGMLTPTDLTSINTWLSR